mmetsp:Transcript_41636/g.93949  ORF Transcript_41636/g.93949 Transcript_41636/m.93949 type:complete len:218 (+) Transcript_41636:489-1142(+)
MPLALTAWAHGSDAKIRGLLELLALKLEVAVVVARGIVRRSRPGAEWELAGRSHCHLPLPCDGSLLSVLAEGLWHLVCASIASSATTLVGGLPGDLLLHMDDPPDEVLLLAGGDRRAPGLPDGVSDGHGPLFEDAAGQSLQLLESPNSQHLAVDDHLPSRRSTGMRVAGEELLGVAMLAAKDLVALFRRRPLPAEQERVRVDLDPVRAHRHLEDHSQ